eukprot:gb/GFBE01029950.1/.p1 GENE.gb/GFBE01029950.1/~~gb/GFBE01029950.1/.p1  ORF type:complete len:235 (+),score=43.17 gb/GFBE01029950.1/:1-705(+)
MAPAFVITDNYYNKDSDGEMDERSDTVAWVFPAGMEQGSPVQHYNRHYSASGFPRYGSVTTEESEMLAEGVVTEARGDSFTFKWSHAVSRSDNSKWLPTSLEKTKLDMVLSTSRDHEDRGRRSRTSRSHEAVRVDDYRIPISKDAWDALRPKVFVATLVEISEELDGQRSVVLCAMSGEEVTLTVDGTGTTVDTVASALRERFALSESTQVRVVAVDGNCIRGEIEAAAAGARK